MTIEGPYPGIQLTINQGNCSELVELLADGKPTALIMRGISGSGKSTIAEHLSQKFTRSRIHSTDSFHVQDDTYRFQPERLGEFHQANQLAFSQSIKEKVPLVICDNTNLASREYQPYIQAANQAGYRVVVALIVEDAAVAGPRNNHRVPQKTIEKQLKRLEANPRI